VRWDNKKAIRRAWEYLQIDLGIVDFFDKNKKEMFLGRNQQKSNLIYDTFFQYDNTYLPFFIMQWHVFFVNVYYFKKR